MFQIKLIVASISFLLIFYQVSCKKPNIDVITGTVNETTYSSVSSTLQKIVYYDLKNISYIFTEANVRIKVDVSDFDDKCPVLFSVREQKEILSWELPIIQKDSRNNPIYYYSTQRTLCTEFGVDDIGNEVQIEISTCSSTLIDFTVSVHVSNDIVVRVGENRKDIIVSPVSPVYYRYDPLPNADSVLVVVSAPVDDDTCVIFSVQQPHCPVLDQEANVQFQGFWQTMTTQGSILLRQGQYPDGFFLVFVALTNGERCDRVSNIYETISRQPPSNNVRTKNFKLSIESVIEPEDYITPVLIPLGFIFGLILIIFVVFSIFQNALQRLKDTDEVYLISDLSNGKSIFHSCLCLDDLKETDLDVLKRRSNSYYWSILTIGIFYCVPVIQLISNYLKVLYRTGDYDLCYYNYRCARPLGYIMDFNHIYSNIGYVLFGFTFLLFVNFRQRSLTKGYSSPDLNENMEDPPVHNIGIVRRILPRIFGKSANDYGALQSFGLYYALGIALILEGVLSAAYHICPNQSNFQFDTSFMYVIAVLGIVKVYQFRHPVYLSANITFISLAFVAASSVFGLLFNNLIFKICFSVLYCIGMMSLLIYLYHIGFSTDENGVLITSWVGIFKGVFRIKRTYSKTNSSSSVFGRMLLPVIVILLNVTLIAMQWTVMINSNFATQLLAIFVANFALYTFYYATMKLIHGEYRWKLWIQLVVYGTLSIGLWVLSLNYFGQAQSSWEDSPAESRRLNDDCVLFSFYDNHDLWHFASSGALLTSFMLLLTIDDDLITTKHGSIPVF